MKDFFEKIIQPETDELSNLLNCQIPYMGYKRSYPLDVDICNHLSIRYVEEKMTIKGNSIMVMNPFCEDCNQFIGEE